MQRELNGKISLKFDKLIENILDLRKLAEYSQSEFLGDFEHKAAARYLLRESAEICIDVCHRLISLNKLRVPKTFVEAVEIIAEAGFIDDLLLPKLRSIVRFRNLIVHQYHDIDDKMVYEILRSNIDDFESLISQVNSRYQ